ncbi:MAG TPA: hypothetical protein DCM21_01115 [Butyrivibrio sp.]|nr:hypothetical protein [Butyrivibrio sp.]
MNRRYSMKAAVRFQSRGGNTKAVAEIIAKMAGVKAEKAEVTLDEYVDILFVGGGVYMGKMDESLYHFLEKLDVDKVGELVCFSTSGSMGTTLKQIEQIAIKKGISVNENKLLIRMLLRGHSFLGLEGGKLTDKQIEKVEKYTEKVLETTRMG